jgi:NTE family protein
VVQRRFPWSSLIAARLVSTWVCLWLVDAAAANTVQSAEEAAAAPAQARPRIGLVLGGGGAKGAAHVGVLDVLDELRIPVDCVVGTSMGALIGGTLASGMNANELEEAIRRISWQDAIAFRSQRGKMPMRRKLGGTAYTNSLEFGVQGRRITAPSGFISTQNIEQTIQHLVTRSRGVTDFDKLPIPFRAIATDMQSGEMVVLDHGDLAMAMRASMSVPGVFAPVSIEGRVLGDGGLTRNVPVDIARQTCADVVIAVAVPNPVPTVEELRSPLTLMSRTLDVMVGANEKQQLETLGPGDVKIVIDMRDVGSTSFDRVSDAIPMGRAAALAKRADLERLSVPEAEYLAWRDSRTHPERGTVELASVEVHGIERVNPDFVRHTLGFEAGEVVDERQIAGRVNAVYALSDFESATYSLFGDPARPALDLELREKSWGPHILRFDLGLYIGTDANTAFTIGGDYLQTWINDRGGELHGALRLGRTSGLDASLYQPVDPTHTWFVEPGLTAQRSLEDIFVDGDSIARYELSHAWGYLDAGRVFGTRIELRAGIRAGVQSADREIGLPGLGKISSEGYGGYALRYTYDTRDRDVLWHDGSLVRVSYYYSEEELGAEVPYERLEGMAVRAFPVGGNVAYLRVAGGASLDTDLPVYDTFTLGGPVSMPGLSLGELRGTSYWSAQASYLQRIAEISYVFGQAMYAGFTLSAGDMSGRLDRVHDEPVYSGAFVVTGRTPLGPVTLSLAATSNSTWQLVFGLGRPIEERAITDPVW